MESVAETGLERGAIERHGLCLDGKIFEALGAGVGAGEIVREVPIRPAREMGVLQGGDRQPIARAVGGKGDRIAVERRQGIGLQRRVVGIAEAVEEPAAKRLVLRTRIGEPGDHGGIEEILRRLPAVALEHAMIDPLKLRQAIEERIDVAEKTDPCRR